MRQPPPCADLSAPPAVLPVGGRAPALACLVPASCEAPRGRARVRRRHPCRHDRRLRLAHHHRPAGGPRQTPSSLFQIGRWRGSTAPADDLDFIAAAREMIPDLGPIDRRNARHSLHPLPLKTLPRRTGDATTYQIFAPSGTSRSLSRSATPRRLPANHASRGNAFSRRITISSAGGNSAPTAACPGSSRARARGSVLAWLQHQDVICLVFCCIDWPPGSVSPGQDAQERGLKPSTVL